MNIMKILSANKRGKHKNRTSLAQGVNFVPFSFNTYSYSKSIFLVFPAKHGNIQRN